ncbi:MAG: tRNA pseudouridine(38-40) synthase TruA [Betaproteobacteria bacterium]|jgi:tRNA pseudouridine38-40 synthase|nr:tRNA pseudouridine(38-40) synthase TruA [Betaproteobacteria bacterium]
MKIALGLAYDGSPYQGWQTQPGGGAVQDFLQSALAEVSGHPVATICAGRTDAGVHATAQVVHFETTVDRPLTAWVRGANAHLPGEIAVQWARVVEAHFHARYSARARSYRYLILRSPVRQPLWRSQAAWVFRPLDLESMRSAAARLVGEHDFSAFRAAACQAATPVRQVYDLTIAERDAFLAISIRANAFLHHMVRNLVGALVEVGLGHRSPDWIDELLNLRDRRLSARTFPACGLTLVGVDYAPEYDLPRPGATAPGPW